MNLNALAMFVAVADGGSYSNAAAAMGVSKSTASQRVKDLESELGVQLLVRTPRKIRLTEAGQALFDLGRDIVDAAARAEELVSRHRESPIGTLRVSTPVSFGRRFIGDVVSELLGEHPGLSVQLDVEDRDVDLIGERYDVAVRVGDLTDSGLSSLRIGVARWYVVASPSYLEAHGRPEHPSELSGHDCLRYLHRRPPGGWSFTEKDGTRLSVKVAGRFGSNNGDVIAERAAAGLGLAWLPEFVTARLVGRGELVRVLEAYCDTEASIQLLFPSRMHRPLKAQLFTDALRRALS